MLNTFPQKVRRKDDTVSSVPPFPLSYPSGILNYYSLLSIPFDASNEQIRKAYLRFNRLAHPMTANENLTHLFKAAQDAYEVLSKRESRAAYDAYLRKLDEGAMTPSAPLGVPLGSFPVVKLEELSWGKDVVAERRLLRHIHIPGGNIESYQHAVVANAANLLLNISGTSLYGGVHTPSVVLDHVGVRKGQVVVVGSILCPVGYDGIEYIKKYVDAAAKLKSRLGRVLTPDVKVFIAVLPQLSEEAATVLKGELKGVDVVYGDLADMIDQAGVALLQAGKSSLLSKSYCKILEGMRK